MVDYCQQNEPIECVKNILKISESLGELKDIDAILDRILTESRRLSDADAGTIYLVKNDSLKFSYVQNDTLIKTGEVDKAVYSNISFTINDQSIVGYVAMKGRSLHIDDVYNIEPDMPFHFNPALDRSAGYKTTSMLTIPIKSSMGIVIGVIQIINPKEETGASIPFSKEAQTFLPIFANNASVAIDRGIMTRELVLRMIKMAELRDPSETGAHVQRVGAYSAEIYNKWALMHDVDEKERKHMKDLIRIAAMLHDVGKVGVSDMILKKPARLSDEEYAKMKFHTVYGARLFSNSTSELDALSGDIAINHHEKWDGTGYPGEINALHCDPKIGQPKKGEDIPLAARICALADVFDALSSKRAYKPPWPDDKILKMVTEESGSHFDPEVVDAFLAVFDIINAIREKYMENEDRNLECAFETRIDEQ